MKPGDLAIVVGRHINAGSVVELIEWLPAAAWDTSCVKWGGLLWDCPGGAWLVRSSGSPLLCAHSLLRVLSHERQAKPIAPRYLRLLDTDGLPEVVEQPEEATA